MKKIATILLTLILFFSSIQTTNAVIGYNASNGLKQPCGVSISMKTVSKYNITWKKTKGAEIYKITLKQGKKKKTKTTQKNKLKLKGLKKGKNYSIKITPYKMKKKCVKTTTVKGAPTSASFYTGLKKPKYYDYEFDEKKMSITYEAEIGNVNIELYKAKDVNGPYEKVGSKERTQFCDTDNYCGTPPVLTPLASIDDSTFEAGGNFIYKARVCKKNRQKNILQCIFKT